MSEWDDCITIFGGGTQFLPAGWLVLRLLYVFASVCSSTIITCAKYRHSVTMPL